MYNANQWNQHIFPDGWLVWIVNASRRSTAWSVANSKTLPIGHWQTVTYFSSSTWVPLYLWLFLASHSKLSKVSSCHRPRLCYTQFCYPNVGCHLDSTFRWWSSCPAKEWCSEVFMFQLCAYKSEKCESFPSKPKPKSLPIPSKPSKGRKEGKISNNHSGSLNYTFWWGSNNAKPMMILRDFPLQIVYCLGWCHISWPPEGTLHKCLLPGGSTYPHKW